MTQCGLVETKIMLDRLCTMQYKVLMMALNISNQPCYDGIIIKH